MVYIAYIKPHLQCHLMSVQSKRTVMVEAVGSCPLQFPGTHSLAVDRSQLNSSPGIALARGTHHDEGHGPLPGGGGSHPMTGQWGTIIA